MKYNIFENIPYTDKKIYYGRDLVNPKYVTTRSTFALSVPHPALCAKLYTGQKTKDLLPITDKGKEQIKLYLDKIGKIHKTFVEVLWHILHRAYKDNFSRITVGEGEQGVVVYHSTPKYNLVIFNTIPNLEDYIGNHIQIEQTEYYHQHIIDLTELLPYIVNKPNSKTHSIKTYNQGYNPFPSPKEFLEMTKEYPYRVLDALSNKDLIEIYINQAVTISNIFQVVKTENTLLVVNIARHTPYAVNIYTKIEPNPDVMGKLNREWNSAINKANRYILEFVESEADLQDFYNFRVSSKGSMPNTKDINKRYKYELSTVNNILNNKVEDFELEITTDYNRLQECYNEMAEMKSVWVKDLQRRAKDIADDRATIVGIVPYLKNQDLKDLVKLILIGRLKGKIISYNITTAMSDKTIYFKEGVSLDTENLPSKLKPIARLLLLISFRWIRDNIDSNIVYELGTASGKLAEFKRRLKPDQIIKL